MQKIMPCLWFDGRAEEAVQFYTSLFRSSGIKALTRYGDAGAEAAGMPKGAVMTIVFELHGQKFMALNGGPIFSFTPAISLFVHGESPTEVDALWNRLTDGGTVLMELNQYPFSPRFGWVQDRYGLSWQINLSSNRQKIVPFLMFVGKQHGRAEAAINFYTARFQASRIGKLERYAAGESEPAGTVKSASFLLGSQEFMAIDSALEHPFTFTPAISLIVQCQDQAEIDHFWEKLSEGGETSQCGWLEDPFGVSWQVVPAVIGELLTGDPQRAERVMGSVLQMQKLDLDTIMKVAAQNS